MMKNKVRVNDVLSGRVDITTLEGGEHVGYVLFLRSPSENKKGDLLIFIEDHNLLDKANIEDIEEIKADINRKLPSGLSNLDVCVGLMFFHGDMDNDEDEDAFIRVKPKDGADYFLYEDMVTLENILELLQNNTAGQAVMAEVGGKLICFK